MKSKRPSLDDGALAFGILQTHPAPYISELAGLCGYDFVLLDGEHGLFDMASFDAALRALRATEAVGLARISPDDLEMVGCLLDLGAAGIVAPNVKSAAQARALVQAMHYPPAGSRGYGAAVHRLTRYGLDLNAHHLDPRAGASLYVILETLDGAKNAHDILAVDGVDGAIIGPSDLKTDAIRAGDKAGEAYARAIDQVEAAAAACKKVLGAPPLHAMAEMRAKNYRLIILDADTTLLQEAMTAQLAVASSALDGKFSE